MSARVPAICFASSAAKVSLNTTVPKESQGESGSLSHRQSRLPKQEPSPIFPVNPNLKNLKYHGDISLLKSKCCIFATMRRLLYIMLLLVATIGCTTDAEQTKMRSALDSINVRNRTGLPFSVSDVEPFVRYFNSHGTPQDRLLAYYLLGRAYYDQGEAPMSLQCYYDAIGCADTTSADCDYYTLSRCYAQVADLRYQQALPNNKEIREIAIHYSLLAKDTLAALSDYEQEANDYERSGKEDSAFFVIDSLINWYNSHGYRQDAAISSGRAFSILVGRKNYSLARRYMQAYEEGSGFFDEEGKIEPGREIYYYYKALLLMNENKLDSAEFFLRRELCDADDYNNQNASSQGLALLFKMRQIPDSAMKYALYSYAMNDSVYAQMTTKEIEQIQSLYDYTRYQKETRRHAEQEAEERQQKGIIILILCLISILSYLVIRKLNIKRKEENKKYKEGLAMIAHQQAEVMLLRQHELDYEQLIADKEKQIEIQKKELGKYRKATSNAEKDLQKSENYQYLMKLAVKGQIPTDGEWQQIYMLIIEYFPGFNDFITSRRYQLNMKEYHTCILFRLHLKSQDISHILSVSPAYISKISTEIMQKLFNEKGSAKHLIEKLNDIS